MSEAFTPEGRRIFFEDSGGDGLPILLAHGFLMDHRSFDAQVAELSDYRWIRWDMRGHGKDAGTPDESYDFWDQARDGLAILDSLDIDRAVFGGHSQGGFVSLRMSLLDPSRCAGLLLFSTTDLPYAENVREGYRAVFSQWTPGVDANRPFETTLASTMIGGSLELQQTWRSRWAERGTEGFSAAVDCLLGADDISSLVGAISAPALIVRGIADQAFSREEVEGLKSRLGGLAHVVTVDGATHGAHMTAPEEVNQKIKEWLVTVNTGRV